VFFTSVRHHIGDEDKTFAASWQCIGSISEFTPSRDTWSSYTERLGYYFVANNVTSAETKRSILLSMCGPSTLKLIKSLVDHESLDTKSFEDICELVKT